MVEQENPERFAMLLKHAQANVNTRFAHLEQLAKAAGSNGAAAATAKPAAAATENEPLTLGPHDPAWILRVPRSLPRWRREPWTSPPDTWAFI